MFLNRRARCIKAMKIQSYFGNLYCVFNFKMKIFCYMKKKKEKRDVALTVRLPSSIVTSLKLLSDSQKNSQSYIIEEAIKMFSKKQKILKEKNETNF